MPYELGGRADKLGNRYEFNWIVLKLIDIVAEKISAIKIEPIGDEEHGVDIWIKYNNGIKEAQQCKGRNGSKEFWNISDLKQKGILQNWKEHLGRDSTTVVSLVSPLPFTNLNDLIFRAKTNDNIEDFISYQVKTSSELKRLFENYSEYMKISSENDVSKIIDFLSRTKIRQEPYPENDEFINDKINQYFIGEPNNVKTKFIDWILSGRMFGRWISITEVLSFTKNEKIKFRNLSRDTRVLPRIKTLNNEYKNRFKTLQSGLKIRTQLDQCVKYIQEGKSIIIHGKAGNGKTGLSENIIEWCEEKDILYLGVKLDSHIPRDTTQSWGEKLGFPASISYCLDTFSKENNAVLVLDQLDALRWTAKNSKNAIATCLELIKEVQNLNMNRKQNISIIFICRSYDLENDAGIKSLFEEKSRNQNNSWQKIEVNELSEEEVEGLLGAKYQDYPSKLKSLLRTPSNLYIWEQIKNESDYYNITNTYNLVSSWWRDLSEHCKDSGIAENDLNTLKDNLVNLFFSTGKLVFSRRRLKGSERALNYLISQGLLMGSVSEISFVHQSFLDCFVAERMIDDYFNGYSTEEIVGSWSYQNPTRRYQFQIFLQSLLEESEIGFLEFGNNLLSSNNVRFNFKYVFLEILGSIQKPSEAILRYVSTLIQDLSWRNHLCNVVVRGHSSYVNFLAKKNVLHNWISEDRLLVIDLLSSISPHYSVESVELIQHSIVDSGNKDEWRGCFFSDYHNDSEEFFKVRFDYWKSNSREPDYPDDFYKNINNHTIKVIQLFLDYLQDNDNNDKFYRESKSFNDNSKQYISENYGYIVDSLLPYIDRFSKINSLKYNFALKERGDLQRYYLDLLHEANKNLASKDPENFFKKYQNYIKTGDFLYNEVILDGLYYLPNSYSDKCVEYLLTDFNKTLFEKSEGYERKLVLAKRLIEKISILCSPKLYYELEDTIIHYISPDAKKNLIRRIEYNKKREANEYLVFWPFWGELQFRLLSILPENRMSNDALKLLQVLIRADNFPNTLFDLRSGSVVSPLQGKKISLKSWKKILINDKKGKTGIWDSNRGVFVESRPEELSRDFRKAVLQEPQRYVSLFLRLINEYDINHHYIDGLLGGIEDLESISNDFLENVEVVLLNYIDSNNWNSIYHFFQILKKHPRVSWSKNVLERLDFYLRFEDLDELDKFSESQSVEKFMHRSYSTARGYGIQALNELIISFPELLSFFKETILFLARNCPDYVRVNLIFLVSTILDLDELFAQKLFEYIFDKDERVIGHWNSSYILYKMYNSFKEKVQLMLKLGFASSDELLVKKSSHLITEIYFNKGDFQSIVYSGIGLQATSICQMAVNYFDNKNSKEKAKDVILFYLQKEDVNLETILPQLFRDKLLDISEDKELILQLLTSKYKDKMNYYFLKFLESQTEISHYEEIIFETVSGMLSVETKYQIEPFYRRRVEEMLSRLMLNLYDEHKEDEISEQCLDTIDMMFENEFGSTRTLINELMQK